MFHTPHTPRGFTGALTKSPIDEITPSFQCQQIFILKFINLHSRTLSWINKKQLNEVDGYQQKKIQNIPILCVVESIDKNEKVV